jgi:hypothetical protein
VKGSVDDTLEDVVCEIFYGEWTEDHLYIMAEEKDLQTEFTKKYLDRNGLTFKEALVNELSQYTRRLRLG